jgi:hypothetical protein
MNTTTEKQRQAGLDQLGEPAGQALGREGCEATCDQQSGCGAERKLPAGDDRMGDCLPGYEATLITHPAGKATAGRGHTSTLKVIHV